MFRSNCTTFELTVTQDLLLDIEIYLGYLIQNTETFNAVGYRIVAMDTFSIQLLIELT